MPIAKDNEKIEVKVRHARTQATVWVTLEVDNGEVIKWPPERPRFNPEKIVLKWEFRDKGNVGWVLEGAKFTGSNGIIKNDKDYVSRVNLPTWLIETAEKFRPNWNGVM